MKEKLSSFFPYLLLALFFISILALNSETDMEKPVYSYRSEDEMPLVSTENNFTETEVSNTDKDVSESDTEQKTETQIIESPTEENSAYTCFYTKNGKKYHFKEDCRYLKNSTKIIKTTVDFATELGLEPCSGCKD